MVMGGNIDQGSEAARPPDIPDQAVLAVGDDGLGTVDLDDGMLHASDVRELVATSPLYWLLS